MIMDSRFFITATFDIAAVLILLGICMTPWNAGEKDDTGRRIFMGMGICIIIGAVLDLITRMPLADASIHVDAIVLIMPGLAEIAGMGFMFFLLLYTDYVFFESRDHLRRHFGPYLIPLAVIAAVVIINYFAGILYTVGDDGVYTPSVLYFVLEIIEYLYLLIPAVHFVICYRRFGSRKFLHPFSICVPIVCGAVLTILTPFSVIYMGFATGLAFLVFSRIDSWRFLDDGTGFYNRNYLEYIMGSIRRQKEIRKGMICFDIRGDIKAFAGILDDELPADSEVICLGTGRFVYLADTGNLMDFEALAGLVECGVDEHCEAHPEDEIDISSTCRMFKDSSECKDALETLQKPAV